MADKDDDNNDLDLTEDEAKRLLDDDDNEQRPPAEGRESATDDTDWKAEAEKWKRLSRTNESQFKKTADRLKQYEDANKSELEKLTDDRDRTRSEAATAKAQAAALSTAIERAPEWATPAIIKKVARRARGDNADELDADIDDLYEMAAPKGAPAPKTPSRPKENLRGGADPEEEVEESDGRKLASRIPRSSILR